MNTELDTTLPPAPDGRWLLIADIAETAVDAKKTTSQGWADAVQHVVSRRRFVLIIAIACTFLSALYSLLRPNKYTAVARVLPPMHSQSSSSAMLGQLGELASLAGRDLGLKNPSALYLAVMRSDASTDALATQFQLQQVYKTKLGSDATKVLLKNTNFELTKEGVIEISVTDRDATRAADLANAYVEQLRALNSRIAITEAAQRRLFFEDQIAKAKTNLTQAEAAFREVQENTGMLQPDAQAKAAVESVARARGELAVREAAVERLRTFATENNPQLIRAERELAALRSYVSKLEASSSQSPGALSASEIPKAGIEYLRRLRELKYCEAVFEFLAKQLEVARIDEAKNGAVIQVLDPAKAPERESGPSRAGVTLGGLLAGLLVGIAFVLLDREGNVTRFAQTVLRNKSL